MDSYIYYANVQTGASIIASLTFLILSSILLNLKYSAANTWFNNSIFLGIPSFVGFYILLLCTNALGSTTPTLGITIIWYISLLLANLQFTTFITGLIIHRYNPNLETLSINTENKIIKKSLILWIGITCLTQLLIIGIVICIYLV
ncbi:hypothetical protein Hokovirus_4_64 [Hokovirus HKV1]|uniref:Uncharacterized protein n=1 Tax=Hokovirus HKV1 TaxID=1977638 RepID=A0A1V0SH86_9VIRU|nr:hypothetical protein Hokovirus_4_64 [Hokovirus HKV1]